MPINEIIYMIRNGGFGTNFEIKFYMIAIAISFCIYDWRQNERLDYFIVLLIGTAIWGSVEFFLQLSGTREFNDVMLFGLDLPVVIASYIRGASEGGVIALIGVGFGDRFRKSEKRMRTILIFIMLMICIGILSFSNSEPIKDVGGDVASRRTVFTQSSVIFLGVSVLITIIWYEKEKNQHVRKRALYMFFTLILFATIWTMIEFFANTRWIEIGNEGSYSRASFFIEFLVLAYDVVVEIGFCYMPYLAFPYMLNWIKKTS